MPYRTRASQGDWGAAIQGGVGAALASPPMHVVIVGCGRVGSGLARIIEDQGHSVAVVDKQPKAFRRLHEGFAGQRIVGVGFDRDRLEEAGVRGSEGAGAAVTSGDNSNILTARVARETFGVDRVVARIYDPRRAVIYERLGIPTIPTVARVVALTRMGTAQIATPDLVTQDGDVVYLAVSVGRLGEIDEHLESAGSLHA